MRPGKEHESRQPSGPQVPAVETACRILFALAKGRGRSRSLSEISAAAGIHRSRGYAILHTLGRHGLVEKDARAKTYRLGPGLVYLARHALEQMDLRELAAPTLKRLAKETGSTAMVGLRSGEALLIVAKEEADQEISVTIPLGQRFPLTHGAHGKAIVAHLGEEEQEKLLASYPLFFYGDPSRMEMGRLRKELETCREVGYAVDPGDIRPGVHALASPLKDHQGKVIGSLILLGTFPQEHFAILGPKLVQGSWEIGRALGALEAKTAP